MAARSVTQVIKAVIRRHLPSASVYLFGSRARGRFDASSDYDVLAISVKKYPPRERLNAAAAIRRELAKLLVNADVVVQSKADWERGKQMPGTLSHEAGTDLIPL